MQLRWRLGGSALAGAGYGDGGVRRRSAAAAAREKGRGEAKMERGATRADAGVMKARPGASWPGWAEQRRRAAVAGDTRRAGSAVGRPLNASFSSSVNRCSA